MRNSPSTESTVASPLAPDGARRDTDVLTLRAANDLSMLSADYTEEQMIDISDSDIFIQILHALQLAEYGLETWYLSGLHPEPAKLLELVATHPELHIVSKRGRRYYNRYILGSECFGVSKDDPNPEYEWVNKPMTAETVRETYEALKAEPDREFPGESAIFATAFLRMFGNIMSARPPLERVVSDETRLEIRDEWLERKG